MKILQEIANRQPIHAEWRKKIHAFPELAYEEKATAQLVADKLDSFGIPYVRGLGRTGIVATIKSGKSDRAIGLRADMDALPLQEKNSFSHRSQVDGKMHACGHDGHTAMLLAAAEYLSSHRTFEGIVHLIFQPAEEGEAGAKAMMDDGLFENFPMESVFALHNWPGLPYGQIAMRKGATMAAMDTFDITIRGKGGHAAIPHLVTDPILAGSEAVQSIQTIVSRNLNPSDTAVVSVTQFHGGQAYNVIPEEVTLTGTVRCFSSQTREFIKKRLNEILRGVCGSHGCSPSIVYESRFHPTVNSDAETESAAAAAAAVCGAMNVDTNVEKSTGSEDFGFMLEEKPGCYAFIGNGPGEGGCLLHSPNYDFNDKIIPIGASYWVQLVNDLLAKQ